MQLQNRRTHYQDQMVLTNHQYQGRPSLEFGDLKKRRGDLASPQKYCPGLSQLVLIVNNWGFVRDTQHDSKVRPCNVSDFQVQLKLSSTTFKTQSNPDSEFPFDKQAANFPFDSFEQLMRSSITKTFAAEVKALYEETEGPISNEPELDREQETDGEEEEEEERPLASSFKSHKRGKK